MREFLGSTPPVFYWLTIQQLGNQLDSVATLLWACYLIAVEWK